MKKEDFISNFKTFSDTWPLRIKQSIFSNLDGFVSDSGFMGEYLGSLITGKKGTASAGMGFDLSDGTMAAEAKLTVWARAAKCKTCNEKVLFFKEQCKCGSFHLEYPSDSRWSIDSKAGIKYKDLIDKYVLQIIKPVTDTFDCLEFIYEAFLIDSNNKYFTEYLMNQYENSTKSNNNNLLPYSFDFYRGEPVKVISLKIKLNEFDSDIDCLYFDLKNDKPEKMKIELLTRDELKFVLKSNSIEFKKSWTNSKLINLINSNLNFNELSVDNFPLRKKNHNKSRGYTDRKI